MKPQLFLRIASILTLVHSILHTVGGVFGKAEPGPPATAVAAMKSNQFLFMGSQRTFWDFHMGLGLGITIFLTVDAAVLWLLGSLARAEPSRLRPILLVYALGYFAFALNSYLYFFLFAVVMETLIALCLILALVAARQSAPASTGAITTDR